jgi:CubicO group peptidase (beta-lactamase class C family)
MSRIRIAGCVGLVVVALTFAGFSAAAILRSSRADQTWAFSDTNFILLGAILQKITGKPLAVALRRQILNPLGLRHATMPSNANIPFACDARLHPATRAL